jgi:hypothetical protein
LAAAKTVPQRTIGAVIFQWEPRASRRHRAPWSTPRTDPLMLLGRAGAPPCGRGPARSALRLASAGRVLPPNTVPPAPYRRRPRRAVWRRSRPSRTGRWRRAELVAGKEQFSTAIGTHSPSPALSGRVAQRYEQLLRPGASGPNIQAPPLALTPSWISPRSRYTTSPGIADLVTRRPLTTCGYGRPFVRRPRLPPQSRKPAVLLGPKCRGRPPRHRG